MTEKIRLIDDLTIHDFIGSNRELIKNKKEKSNSRTFGVARILSNKQIVTDKSFPQGWITNMTIATGREFVAQSIFKKFSTSSMFGDISNYKIDCFGIGSGGAVDDNNNVTLLGPNLGDKGLYAPVAINSQCLTAVNNNNVPVAQIAKPIESVGAGHIAGSITFETSNNIEFTALPDDYYTVVKCNCVIDNTEPSYLSSGQSVKISEAMLFITSPTRTNPKPFAHFCFAPKWIEKESIIEIEWYILT